MNRRLVLPHAFGEKKKIRLCLPQCLPTVHEILAIGRFRPKLPPIPEVVFAYMQLANLIEGGDTRAQLATAELSENIL